MANEIQKAIGVARTALETGSRAVTMARRVLEQLPLDASIAAQLGEIATAEADLREQRRLIDEWAAGR